MTAEHRRFKVIKMQGTNIETQIPYNMPQMIVEQQVAYLQKMIILAQTEKLTSADGDSVL